MSFSLNLIPCKKEGFSVKTFPIRIPKIIPNTTAPIGINMDKTTAIIAIKTVSDKPLICFTNYSLILLA